MASKKQTKPVYTADYYRIEKVVSDPGFKAKVKELRAAYAKAGCPLPAKPFEKYRDYRDWLDLFWERHMAAERDRTEEPITPGRFLDDRLIEAGLDHRNDKFKKALEAHVFYGRPHLTERLFVLRWMRSKPTSEPELFIQLLPHTKKEHIEAHWGEIAEEMKRLPGHLGKSKRWETFERDLEIYRTYQQVKDERMNSGERSGKGWMYKGKPQPLDYEISSRMSEKYPNLTLAAIRKAISRIEELNHPLKEDV